MVLLGEDMEPSGQRVLARDSGSHLGVVEGTGVEVYRLSFFASWSHTVRWSASVPYVPTLMPGYDQREAEVWG